MNYEWGEPDLDYSIDETKEEAMKREYAIKQMTRKEKERLVGCGGRDIIG